jgi:hypothetical protein
MLQGSFRHWDEKALQVKIDQANNTTTYVGEAELGSATSSAVWRIKKIVCDDGLTVTYADGNDNFDNIFDNRASLSYS